MCCGREKQPRQRLSIDRSIDRSIDLSTLTTHAHTRVQQQGLTILASVGSQPAYNVPLALLGVFVPHFPKPILATLLFVMLPVTLVFDITWWVACVLNNERR